MSDQPKKQRKMLSSYSIVFLFLIFTAILTWFVPQSVVVNDHGTKKIIYDAIMVKGKVVAGQGLQPMGLWDVTSQPGAMGSSVRKRRSSSQYMVSTISSSVMAGYFLFSRRRSGKLTRRRISFRFMPCSASE